MMHSNKKETNRQPAENPICWLHCSSCSVQVLFFSSCYYYYYYWLYRRAVWVCVWL